MKMVAEFFFFYKKNSGNRKYIYFKATYIFLLPCAVINAKIRRLTEINIVERKADIVVRETKCWVDRLTMTAKYFFVAFHLVP